MLCQSIKEDEALTLDDKQFQAQIKFDGERIIAINSGGVYMLVNRRGAICNDKFREVLEDLKANWKFEFIVDGEIIALNDDFNLLQRRALTKNPEKIKLLEKEVPVKYMIFDVLTANGENQLAKKQRERMEKLKTLDFSKMKHVELAEFGSIKPMLDKAKAENREGLIIKDMEGYYEHRRSNNWKKLKFFEEGQIIAIKYEQNPRGITIEDANGNRVAVGGAQSTAVKKAIDEKQSLAVYVQYLEKTEDGRMRFPSFRGVVKEEGTGK